MVGILLYFCPALFFLWSLSSGEWPFPVLVSWLLNYLLEQNCLLYLIMIFWRELNRWSVILWGEFFFVIRASCTWEFIQITFVTCKDCKWMFDALFWHICSLWTLATSYLKLRSHRMERVTGNWSKLNCSDKKNSETWMTKWNYEFFSHYQRSLRYEDIEYYFSLC